MYDLLALAYQCDLTRVGTFMIGKEVSGRSYPEIGVPETGCHSHHQNDPVKLKLARSTLYMQHFAYFLDKRERPDGEGRCWTTRSSSTIQDQRRHPLPWICRWWWWAAGPGR
jgi:hypothetical protein